MFPEKVCLLLKITRDTSFDYQLPMKEWFNQHYPDFFVYDLDNFSEAMVTDYALKLLNNAQKIVFILQAEPNSPLGSLLKLMPVVMRHKHKVKAVFQGEHKAIQQMLKPLNEVVYNLPEEELAAAIGLV
ncbi:hypothetical protein [uncultured Microscilla sp.]|uniref:hypothetical protein n=1 Tax=uncultured Microscilla sp. TaxID=432653 RepID=UPI00261FD6DD|nr:hypothetical protein [uncultured Microscilla sp.]